MKLLPIAKEAAACRAAWAAMPDATAGLHIHHETAAEPLTEPFANRIAYILAEKPKREQALRLRLMRPIAVPAWAEYKRVVNPAWAEYKRAAVPAWAEYELAMNPAWAEYELSTVAAWAKYKRVRATAHAAACIPDCPWDGSIFGGKP